MSNCTFCSWNKRTRDHPPVLPPTRPTPKDSRCATDWAIDWRLTDFHQVHRNPPHQDFASIPDAGPRRLSRISSPTSRALAATVQCHSLLVLFAATVQCHSLFPGALRSHQQSNFCALRSHQQCHFCALRNHHKAKVAGLPPGPAELGSLPRLLLPDEKTLAIGAASPLHISAKQIVHLINEPPGICMPS